jgi:glycerone phosphate O-acyltransferase
MCSSSRCYQDFLAPRREELSNFMWASRQINPQIAYKQPTRPSPQYHKDQVLKSPKIQELLSELSQRQNVSKDVLEAQIKNILDEIGYNKKLKVIRWIGLVLVKICNKVCSGIYINEDAIVQLKSRMGNCPVIFVPSHRSYADFILMSLMCFTEDLAIPAIAAGMDFHGMWGMGTMLRDTGAFFMRRSYNDDSLYWTTFKQYIYQIVTKGELPVEFFVEGTRSRSNKSLAPKYGLILMILKAFFLSQVPDILFVPINISYDRILEEKLFAFELLGIPKPKETTSGFFKSLSIVKEKKLVPKLAHEIVYRQQKHCVITTFNLLAIVLHNNLIKGKDLLNVEEIIEEIVWLKGIVEALGGFVCIDNVQKNVLDALEVHQNIVTLTSDGKVTLVSNEIVLDKANITKLKGHELSEKTITLSVPFMMLQIYINPVLHYFVDVAVLVLILKNHERAALDELFGHYRFLRALLSQEFITFNAREKMEFDAALDRGINLKLIATDEELYKLGENKKLEETVSNCIDCFIFTYSVVCSVLLQVQYIRQVFKMLFVVIFRTHPESSPRQQFWRECRQKWRP